MNRSYTVHKYFNIDGRIATSSEQRSFDGAKDMKNELIKEYTDQLKDDPEFVRVKVIPLPQGDIDFELSERMTAIRNICELGHKVRAATKIRNRQPLRNAYISFTDRDIQDYMVYVDCGKDEYANTVKEELNILNVQFMGEEVERSIFDYNIKPNFRSLGPKGYGKQAQTLKAHMQKMSADERSATYAVLKNGESVSILDIPLTLSDIEVEFVAKAGFMSANDKVGAIILDTTLDEQLLDAGFIADFRSSIQNIRKDMSLNLTDKIFLEVFCTPKRSIAIQKQAYRLTKELLATEIKFFPPDKDITEHKFFVHNGAIKTPDQVSDLGELDKEEFAVKLYREEAGL